MKYIIFAIDDEADILEIIKINLEQEGYTVYTYPSAPEAEKALKTTIPDIMILDIMMEEMDGYDFCKKIRATDAYNSIPIIFLSAKTEEFDKVLGLELGGDDYITKPFSVKELKSRIKAVLRRSSPSIGSEGDTNTISYKGIELFPDQYRLNVDGKEVKLTKTEFGILEIFLLNKGKIFSRDNIIDSIRGHNVYVVDRTIDVHIMNLRKKLGPYKDLVKTFSGVGYGFRE